MVVQFDWLQLTKCIPIRNSESIASLKKSKSRAQPSFIHFKFVSIQHQFSASIFFSASGVETVSVPYGYAFTAFRDTPFEMKSLPPSRKSGERAQLSVFCNMLLYTLVHKRY